MARAPKPWYWTERESWFVTIHKQRHDLGPNKAAAIKRFHELMAKPAKRIVRTDSVLTIIDAFLDWTQKHKAADTYEWYRYRLQRFAERYPDLTTAELRPFHVQEWADKYDMALTSRRNYLRSVKRCFKWAAKQGYIDQSPLADLEVPAAENREDVVAEADFERMLSLIPDDSFRDLLIVSWETGCRPQESLRVESRHVDLANRRWVFRKSESKKKKISRVVYLPDAAFQIVERLVNAHSTGPIFRNSAGMRWTTSAVNCAFTRLRIRMGKQLMREQKLVVSDDEIAEFSQELKKQKTTKGVTRNKSNRELFLEARRKLTFRCALSLVPNLCLYAMRHSWATHALVKGVDPLTVSVLMGHRDPSMLAKVYQHVSQNPEYMLNQARRAIE